MESDHAVDDILLEDLVRVAADLLQALRSLVHVLVLRVIRVIACLSISIIQVILVVDWILNLAAIEHLASIVVADFVANRLILSCLSGVHRLRLLWHHVEFDESAHGLSLGLRNSILLLLTSLQIRVGDPSRRAAICVHYGLGGGLGSGLGLSLSLRFKVHEHLKTVQ